MLNTLLASALAAGLFAPSHVAAPAAGGALDLVPADAFFVVHVDSVAGLHEALAGSTYWNFLAGADGVLAESGLLDAAGSDAPVDPRAFLALFGSLELDQATRDALPPEALAAHEFVRGFRGSLTIYASGSPDRPTFGLVMEPGGPVVPFVERLEWLFDVAPVWREREGVRVATETDADFETQSAFVVQGGSFVHFLGAADPRSAMVELERASEKLVTGQGPTLADNPRWVEAAAATAGVGQGRLFVDLESILAAVPPGAFGTSAPGLPSSEAVLDELGFTRLRWLAARGFVGEGETLSFDLELSLPEESLFARLLDLGAGGLPMRFLGRFDEGCAEASAMRFDVAGLFDLGVEVAARFAPAETREFEDQLAQLPQMLGFDPIEGLVRQFSGEFAVARMPLVANSSGRVDAASMLGGETTVVCGLRDARRFDDALWGLFRFFEDGLDQALPIDEVEVAGRDLGRFETPLGHVWFGVGDDAFAVGLHPDRVARALATTTGGRRSPLDDATFARAFQQHPNALFVQVTRTGPAIASAFESMRALGSSPLPGAASPFPAEFTALADFSQRARTTFKGTGASVVERTPRGVRFHVETR